MKDREGELTPIPQDAKPFCTPPERLTPPRKLPFIPMVPLKRRRLRTRRYRPDPFLPTETPLRRTA